MTKPVEITKAKFDKLNGESFSLVRKSVTIAELMIGTGGFESAKEEYLRKTLPEMWAKLRILTNKQGRLLWGFLHQSAGFVIFKGS